MVSIKKQGDNFIFEVKGMHRLWAFKNQLTIPKAHILNAYQDTASIKGSKGLRMPGTYIPTIITAGTFIKNGHMIFWDVSDISHAIIIDLKDENYQKLVIEVENINDSIALLTT